MVHMKQEQNSGTYSVEALYPYIPVPSIEGLPLWNHIDEVKSSFLLKSLDSVSIWRQMTA